jgi:hypothetical protein
MPSLIGIASAYSRRASGSVVVNVPDSGVGATAVLPHRCAVGPYIDEGTGHRSENSDQLLDFLAGEGRRA